MAAPTQERPKVLIPLPPLPEFYQKKAEGSSATTSSSSSSSHAKKTTKSQKGGKKPVAAVKVKTKAKVETLPQARPNLPPAKPLSIEVTAQKIPTKTNSHSFPSAKLPTLPPPPPGLELVDQDKMTYRYSHHLRHVHHPPALDIKATKDSQPHPTRIITIPPPPPGFPGFLAEPQAIAQATLTVYHICRICLRPRSEKYHREHPIPIDGVPPPPGICRRCRITSVEAKNYHTEVIHIEESDKVRLGVSAFVPKDSLYTQDEAGEAIRKQQRKGYAELYVRENSSDEDEHERVVYRYVKRTTKAAPEPPPINRAEVSFENLAAMNLMNDQFSPRLETKRTTQQANVTTDSETRPAQYTAQHVRVTKVQQVDSSKSSSSAKSSKPSKAPTTARPESTKASVSVKTSVAGSQSNVKATAQVTTPAPPVYTESEIRTFARDEVERYRQAERMMHAHPGAYAHGRMVPVAPAVPVERRIEVVNDTPAPKPWEAPSSPPEEPVFVVRRPKSTPATSKAGSGYADRAPTEDSRYWCNHAETEASSNKSVFGTRSTSSKDSASVAGERFTKGPIRSDNSERFEQDVEVRIERGGIPRASQRLPESDPPVSVKLKEVVGFIREEPINADQRSERSSRRHDANVIEVTEEIEIPPGCNLQPASVRSSEPVVSQRVKILRGDRDTQQRQRRSHRTQANRDESYWGDEAVVKTASGHSSAREKIHTEVRVRSRERPYGDQQDTVAEQTEEVFAMPSPRQFLPNLSSHGRSDDDSWYESRVKGVKKHQQAPWDLTNDSKRQDDDDDKTVWPADDAPVRPAASERASLREDWDWEYTKRTVTAIDRPPGMRFDDSAPGKEYTDTERMFRRRCPSQSGAPAHKNDRQTLAPSSRVSEKQVSAAPSSAKVSVRSRIEQGPPPPQERGRGPYMRNSDESAHVHFASKVEFSPTPPGSDEPLPERILQIKSSSHSSKKPDRISALRNQIDGGASEPPESAENNISVYETNRAMSGRSVNGREDLDYVSARCASSAQGSGVAGSRAVESHRSEPRSYCSQASRASGLRGGSDAYGQYDEDEQRSGRSVHRSDTGRRFSPGGTETATQPSSNRRLTRALSESPSRERMHQEFLRAQRERCEPESVASRGRHDWHEREPDGKGPYREESRTESMDALYGSGHGGPRGKQREYVVRERW